MVISSYRELQPPSLKTYECIQPRFVAEEDRITPYLLRVGGSYSPVKSLHPIESLQTYNGRSLRLASLLF